MNLKNLKAVERNPPAFAGFKRFEERDVVSEGGKSVVYFPGKLDEELALRKLRDKFKLVYGVDYDQGKCIVVTRKISSKSPPFNSKFPVDFDFSQNVLEKEENIRDNRVAEGVVLIAKIYDDHVVSPDKKMALKVARMLQLKED